MNNKKIISVIAVIMAVLMLASLVVSMIPVSAFADEPEGLSELKAQKEQLSNQVKDCMERLQALKDQQANVLEQKAALDEQKKLANEQLRIIAKEIDQCSELIAEKAKEVDAAKNKEERQLEKYRGRVRAMEENGGYNILAVILQASNFSELLTAFDDMGEIMSSDKTLQAQYVAAREETEEVKARYEQEKAEYEATQTDLKAEQKEISDQIAEADKTLKSLESEIEKAIAEYEAAEAAEQATAASITNMIAQYNAQKAAEAAQAKSDAENAALMKHCKLFLHPAVFEGFGIPPLEALALGAPVALANATCLPELYGDTARYFDPYDYDVDLDALAAQPVAAPDEVLKKYSWDKTAEFWLHEMEKYAKQ